MTQMSETKDPVIKLFGKTIHLPVENRGREDLEVNKEASVNTPPTPENCAAQDATARINDNPKTSSIDNETAALNSSRTKYDHSDTSVSEEEKTLKKPDKNVPCPRCNSMDTKFCYYNNYNVRQPRHFCKKCQRYWTAGGTMRNVPMGAGSRQNKSSVSHFRQIDVSEPLHQRAQTNLSIGINHPPTFKPNVILKAPALSLRESMELKLATENFNPSVPTPALRPSAYPMPFHPAATWNIPYTPNPFSHKHQIHCHPKSSLGKRSRDDGGLVQASNTFEEDACERRLWIPKTLRIDDPKEAAKSSIWETLGITNETGDSMEGRGSFKAFQSKGHEKNHILKKCTVFNANPVAMCRSLNFHESS